MPKKCIHSPTYLDGSANKSVDSQATQPQIINSGFSGPCSPQTSSHQSFQTARQPFFSFRRMPPAPSVHCEI